jgi:hypothetical protein
MKNMLLVFSIIPLFTCAQNHLDTSFLLPGTELSSIAAIVIDNDTIVCLGNAFTAEGNYATHISKYDTLGNLLSYNFIQEQGNIIDAGETSGFIKTSDGGYAALSGTNLGLNALLIKFDHDLQTEWIIAITRPDMLVIYAEGLVETSDGYLVAGYGGNANQAANSFVCKLDKEGNIQWNKKYSAQPNWNSVIRQIIKKNENSFWLNGGRSMIGSGCDAQKSQGGPWIVEIDSLGNVQYDWKAPLPDNEGAGPLALDDDGQFVYAAVKIKFNNVWGDTLQLKLRKINPATGQTVWEYYQTPIALTCPNSRWSDLAKNPVDGGWDMVGSYQHKTTGYVTSGVAAHTYPNGELRWFRLDTNYVSPNLTLNYNWLRCLGHLSSGSIVAGGFVRKAEPELHDEAWLIKYSVNGCVGPTDCATVSDKSPVRQAIEPKVYPNPFSNKLSISFSNEMNIEDAEFVMINVLGQEAEREKLHGINSEINLEGLPKGIYFWQIWEKRILLGQGKLVKDK